MLRPGARSGRVPSAPAVLPGAGTLVRGSRAWEGTPAQSMGKEGPGGGREGTASPEADGGVWARAGVTWAKATLRFCPPSRSAPSPSMGDIPAYCPAVEPPRSESPSHSEKERHPSEPAAALQSPRVPPLLPEVASGTPADTGSEEQPSDHPDGESPSSWGEQRLSLTTPQPEGSVEQGQEFPLLEVSGSGEIAITLYGLGHRMSVDGAL